MATCLASLLIVIAAAPQPAQGPDPSLIRVYVHTEDGGDADELGARQQSVKDLVAAITSKKKKTLAVVETRDAADVVVEVLTRGLETPRVVIGLAPRPGQPGAMGTGMVRTAVLQVGVTIGPDDLTVRNKNKPNTTPNGWKGAAENIVDQVDKSIAERRAAILARRGGSLVAPDPGK